MSKGDKKKKIIASIASSVALVGGATTGILYTSETEIENEAIENEEEKAKRSKLSNGAISQPIKMNIGDGVQELTTLLPASPKILDKVYLDQDTSNDKQQKIRLAIADVLHNKYHIDVTKVAIKIDSNQNQVTISSLNKDVYTGSVTLKYALDMSFVTLDYLVPDLHTRQQKVAAYRYYNHEDIIDAKTIFLNDKEFKNLPKVNGFINKLNEKVKYKASNEAINAFNKLENNNENFKNFEDLKQQIDQHNLSFNGKINFDAFINTITKYYCNYNMYNYYSQIDINASINILKNAICRFYNILAQVYGKDNTLKMLQKIKLDQQFYENSPYQFVRTSIFRFL